MKLALEQHMASCEPCQADYAALARVTAILSEGLPEVDLPAGFHASLMERLQEQARLVPPAPAVTRAAAPSPLARLGYAWHDFTHSLTATPRRAFAAGAACALLLVSLFGGLGIHSLTSQH